jgi:hypothetical protein
MVVSFLRRLWPGHAFLNAEDAEEIQRNAEELKSIQDAFRMSFCVLCIPSAPSAFKNSWRATHCDKDEKIFSDDVEIALRQPTLSRRGKVRRHDGGLSMEYMLLIHADETKFGAMPEAARNQALAAYGAYTQALREAGVVRSSNRLRPADTSTLVRVRDGKSEVLNGPFIETREELGGYYLIDVPDLDAALSWAARCPGASHGTIEVRPVWAMGGA